MGDVECKLVEDQEVTHVSLSGLKEADLIVDCSGDVDFTELVTVLADRIDTGEPVQLQIPESDDEKTTIILEAVAGIIEKYNESLTSDDEAAVGEEIPF